MENNRKNQEAKFHDTLRGENLKKDSSEFERLTSNYKFYSIVKRSSDFIKKIMGDKYKNKKVLDYCCGEGEESVSFAKQGIDIVGIDISDVSIEKAKKLALKNNVADKTSFFVMDAEKTTFTDNYFDVVFCGGVLHHLDTSKAFKEIARIIKQDGEVICDEPLSYNPVFQLYRKLTPHLRTEWEAKHILSKKDINIALNHFNKVEKRFFHLFTLLAVPFRNIPFIFNPLLFFLGLIDAVVLRMPFIKWWAWQIIFILSEPKK